MRNFIKVFLMILLLQACLSLANAFIENLSEEEILILAEELQEEDIEMLMEFISEEKQMMRELSKQFLIDELPQLIALDPEQAGIALESFSESFNYMRDEEVRYLLGHLYARIGQTDRAIDTFAALLETDFDLDSRKMMGLMFHSILSELIEAGENELSFRYLNTILSHGLVSDELILSYLYLFSELNQDKQEVLNTIQSYMENNETLLEVILPVKNSVLSRLEQIDFETFYQNPSENNLKAIIRDIDQIEIDLGALNSIVQEMPNTLFKPRLNKQHKSEVKKLQELRDHLTVYAGVPLLSERVQDQTLDIIAQIRVSIQQYYRTLDIIEAYLNKYYADYEAGLLVEDEIFMGDLYLDSAIQLEQTVKIYEEMLEILDELLLEDIEAGYLEELRQQREEIVSEKARIEAAHRELLANVEFESSEDMIIFEELLDGYNDIQEEARLMTLICDEIEDFVMNDMTDILGVDLKQAKIDRVDTGIQELLADQGLIDELGQAYEQSVTELDFITLKLKYRRQIDEYEAFIATQNELSDDELFENQAIQRGKLSAIANEIEAFRREHPNYQGMIQPTGIYFAQEADLHYMLGELEYYAHPEDMTIAQNHFRSALRLDPKFPDRDLALYNLAFISTELIRQEVDNNKISYRMNARVNEEPPANSIYSVANFAEPFNALTEIVNNYPNSKMHEDAIYRLGLLNFSFARDSKDPEQYEDAALAHFNQIIANEDSPLYYEALYQRGWVRMNSFEHDVLRQAMDDFVYILLAIDAGHIEDPQLVADYRQDAVDNIAYCLIAFDGTDFYSQTKSVAEVQRVFNNYSNEEVMEQIIDGAIRNKLDLSASTQAVDLLELKLNAVPYSYYNPVILDSILVLYHNAGQELRDDQDLDAITQNIYQRMIDEYGYGSKWYDVNKDKEISRQLDIIENAYSQKAIRLFNNFANNIGHETLNNYDKHMAVFEKYAELHNDDYLAFKAERDSVMVFNYAVLASTTEDSKDFVLAISKLNEYNDKYPHNTRFFEYEQMTLEYAKALFVRAQNNFADPDFVPVEGDFTDEDEAFTFLQNRTTRYMNVIRQEEYYTAQRLREANDLILLLADTQFMREKLPEATQLYLQALQEEDIMTNSQKRETYLKLADMSERQGEYAKSEGWFRQALAYAQNSEDEANIRQDILVQIQNSFEKASESGDFITEANERLRLAAEMGAGRGIEVLGQKNAAVEAFTKAGAYQQAIDLLMELAETDDTIDAVYYRYHQAIEIAEEKMLDKEYAQALESEFLTKYPASLYAFQLRLASVSRKAVAEEHVEAAEGFLQLFNEARANTIDYGDQVVSELLMDAILMNSRANRIEEEYRLCHQFIELYPELPEALIYLEHMVVGHRDRNEMDEHLRLAKELMKKDPSKDGYYKYYANSELHKVALRFDEAYNEKDYTQAFAIRDEYRTMQHGFENEGLSFDNQAVYNIFAQVQAEYDELQRKLAYLKSFDDKLSAIEHGDFMSKTPNQHVRVNNLTTWNRNLENGDRRIPLFNTATSAEVKKVEKILNDGFASGYYLDNDRITRSYNLMAKIHEKAVDVLDTQVRSYWEITGEGRENRNYYGENFGILVEQTVWQQILPHIQASLGYHSFLHTNYYLAGYENSFTEAAITALNKYEQIPEYRTVDYVLDNQWQITGNPQSADTNITQIRTPKNVALGSINVPAENTLTISRSLQFDLEPDFALLQLIFPLEMDIWVNGSAVSSSWVPVDTLDTKNADTTRYSYMIDGSYFAPGGNELQIVFNNNDSSSLQAAAAVKLFTSRARILENIPPVSQSISSSTNWIVYHVDDEGEEIRQRANLAENWNIENENLFDWESAEALPIWIVEDEETTINNIVFETEFMIDTQFLEGMIDIIAPESVTVYLNDVEIGGAMFDYDPEPLTVYKSQILIEPHQVVEGRNVLRFEVENFSEYRGIMANIHYLVAGKEEIR